MKRTMTVHSALHFCTNDEILRIQALNDSSSRTLAASSSPAIAVDTSASSVPGPPAVAGEYLLHGLPTMKHQNGVGINNGRKR